MRLIDADEMMKRLQAWNTDDKIDNALYRFALMRIIEAPTVKAIPIDWIIHWLTKQTIPATSYGLDCSAVEKMLDDWEKENGRSE